MKQKSLPLFASIAFARTSLFICAALCAATTAHADKTWTGNTDATWGAATNWLEAAIPLATDTVIFDANSTLNLGAITLGGKRTARGIIVTSPAADVTIATDFSITLVSGGFDMSAATKNFTSMPGITIQSAMQPWNVAAGFALTTPVPVRNGGANNDTIGGHIVASTTGTIKMGVIARATVLDGGDNPFVTFGTSDWAATDATGTLIAATYVPWSAEIAINIGNADVTGSFSQTATGTGATSIRFADAVTAHTVTIADTFTGRGILVTPTSVGGTITGGFLRPNRGTTTGASLSIIQNSTLGDLVIGSVLSNASSNTPVSVIKGGAGKLIFTNTNGHTGRLFIHEGTVQFGNAGTTGAPGGPASIINNGSLVFNRTDTLGVITDISGSGAFTQAGTGEITLTSSVSTFTGAVNINAGTLAVTTMANLGSGTAINIDNATFTFLGEIDPSARTVTMGATGATFDTNGKNITFAAAVGNGGAGSLTKAGHGSLVLTQPAGWTGATVVNGGTLIANNTTGSATSGSVTLNTAGSLGGMGTVSGAVTTVNGSTITPGSGGVGTLTVGSLTLESGSVSNFEFNGSNDLVNVTTGGGLRVNGGTVNLYAANLATPFSGTVGTYNLFQYTGTLGGAATNLIVGNPQADKSYTFSSSAVPGYLTVTIANIGVVRDWITNGDGSWATAGNWNGTVPDVAEGVANFNTELSAPATVTLDVSKTVGTVVFTSAANGYTIAQGSGGSLILNNSASDAYLVVSSGAHTISAPVSLSNNLAVSVSVAGNSLSVSGNISGALMNLVKTGAGDLNLTGSNTFSGDISLTGGSTSFGPSGLGTGGILLDNTKLVWDGHSADISSGPRTVYLVDNTVTFDTNGNDVVLANTISGTGNFTKSGAGILTLLGVNGYGIVGTTGTTINGGVLQIADDSALGFASGFSTVDVALAFNAAGSTLRATSTLSSNRIIHLGGGVTGTTPKDGGTAVSGTIDVAAGQTATWIGEIAGTDNSSSLEVTGAGTLFLNNTASTNPGGNRNAISGGVYIHGGTVKTGSGPQFGDSILTADAGGKLISNQNGSFNAFVYIGNAGGHVRETALGYAVWCNGPVANVTGQTGSLTYQGSGAGNAGKQGLGGNNTFVGDVTVEPEFTLSISQDANLGNSANALVLNSATLAVEHGAESNGAAAATAVAANVVTTRTIKISGSSTIDVGDVADARNAAVAAANNGTPGVLSGATIINGASVGSLTKAGVGALAIAAANYTGNTTVNAGSLAISTASLANAADVTIAATGKLTLNFAGTDTVDELTIAGVAKSPGTYGATGSGATHIDDVHFDSTGTGTLTVTTGPFSSAYDTWAASFGAGFNATNYGATQDPDNDGIENELEFVLGGNPLTSSTSILPTKSLDATNFYFTFNRADESEAEITAKFQYASTLTGWTDVAIGAASALPDVTVTENGTAPDAVTVTIPRTSAVAGKLFGRLNVVK